jgi:transglutaminase-like putative cysteine protease
VNHRLTIAAAAAVILASFSEFALIRGSGWLAVVSGAVLVVALAGTLTRAAPAVAAAGATVLAAVAVVPLLASSSPYLIAVGLIVVGSCAASAWRITALRAFAAAVTYLAALLLYLNVLLAHRQSVLWVIPAARSLRHLVHLAQAGSALAAYAPPVLGTPGVHLLAGAGIGVAAIAVDIVAVRLRRPALAGLPLLVVYLAPVATYANLSGLASAVAFAFAAVGYLALLAGDGRTRLRRWGKLVTVWHSADADGKLRGADVAALSATGRRIGLAAVCAAVIAPLLLPSLSLHHLFKGSGGGGAGSGSQPFGAELPDPVTQLRTLLGKTTVLPVLSYRPFGAGQGSDYLQIYVLNYDSAHSKWELVQPPASAPVTSGSLLPAPGLAAATATASSKLAVTFSRHVNGYRSAVFFLPVPYWPGSVQVAGSNWHEARDTLMIYSAGIDPAGLRYTVISDQAVPIKSQLSAPQRLPAEIRRDYTGFSSIVTAQLLAIEQGITRRQHTAFLKAVALERWFQSGRFRYTLASDLPNSPQGLLQFLTTTRHGNCQQFAFAMAVLARLAGIPSRIAIGYTPGTRQANGTWLVTTADAHAWPELYFTGIGWLRFEPTPGGQGGQGTAVQPTYATQPNLPTTAPTTNPSTNFPRSHRTRGTGVKPIVGRGGGGPAGRASGAGGRGAVADVGLVLLAIIVAGSIAPAVARLLSRRRRWRGASGTAAQAEAAWLEIRADLEDFGQPPLDSDSPRMLARRVRFATDDDPAAAEAITRITAIIERARYAAALPPPVTLRGDVRVIRRAMTRRSGQRARWQARLLPASTIRPARAAVLQSLGVVTGWMPTPRDELA